MDNVQKFVDEFKILAVEKLVGCKAVSYRQGFKFLDSEIIKGSEISVSGMGLAVKLGLGQKYCVLMEMGLNNLSLSQVWTEVKVSFSDHLGKLNDKRYESDDDLLTLIILDDTFNGKYHYLYSEKHFSFVQRSWESIKAVKEDREYYSRNHVSGVIIRDPLKPRLIKITEGHHDYRGFEVWEINQFEAPVWPKMDAEAFLDPNIDLLLRHILINDESYEYVLKWMYIAFTYRCETYLTLNGAKGAGKTLLASLIKSLVGRRNSSKAGQSLISSKFNGIIRGRKLIELDELIIRSDKEVGIMKSQINNYIVIEEKGKNADSEERNHCSFMITNNSVSDIRIESDDRRFSVMDITEKRLDTIKNGASIASYLSKEFENPDSLLVAQFGKYLQEKFVGYTEESIGMYDQYRGVKYWQIVFNTCTAWQKVIISQAIMQNCPSINYKELRRVWKKASIHESYMPLGMSKIIDFVRDYRHRGICSLGTCSVDDVGNILICFNQEMSNYDVLTGEPLYRPTDLI